MRKKLGMLVVTLLAVGCLAWASGKSWNGTVSDSHCGAKHAIASEEAAACVTQCVAGGAKYVLVSGGKVYQLDAQDKFAHFAGKSVKVTGSLKGHTITVESVEALR
jgi:hypothetical protein